MSMTALKPLADMPVTGAGKLPAAAAQQNVDLAELLARPPMAASRAG